MSDNSIQITVTAGGDYEPTPRLRAALGELDAALSDAHGDVEGFGESIPLEEVSFVFHTITWTFRDKVGLDRVIAPRDVATGQLKP